MSSMVKPTHLSIQQNSWRWKFVKIRFSCWERERKKERKEWRPELKEGCCSLRLSGLYLVDEVLHFSLQTPPSELDGHQLVRTHVRTFRLQLVLWREDESWSLTPPLTANLCVILYLPLRTKRPSACLRGLEQSRIFLCLVVLKPHKDANVNELLH